MATTIGIKLLSNWYVAAVISTGLQMPELPGVEPRALLGHYIPHYPDTNNSLAFSRPAPTETVIPITPACNFITSVETQLTQVESDDEDITVRPKYVKEVKMKVGSFKIDKSLPKIFID